MRDIRLRSPAALLAIGPRSRFAARARPGGSQLIVPPWLIVSGATLLTLGYAHFLAQGKVKYSVGILLAATVGPLAFFDLAVALSIWTALLFFQDLHVLSFGPNAFGVLVAVGWIGAFAARARTLTVIRRHRGLLLTMILFALWLSLSSVWAEQSGRALSTSGFWWLGALAALITMSTAVRFSDIRAVCLAFVAGATVAALIGLATTGLGASTQQVTQTAVEGRLTGGGGDPNLAAAAFVASMFVTIGLMSIYRKGMIRLALVTSFILVTIAFFATQSRGGLIAVGVATVASLFLAPGQRRRILSFATLLILLAALASATHPGALSRITNVSGGTSGRGDIWSIAATLFLQHPVVGIGLNNFQVVEARYTLRPRAITRIKYIAESPDLVHNTYLELLSETGIVGLLGFLAVVVGCLRAGWLAARSFDRRGLTDYGNLARAVLMATIGMLSADFFIQNGEDWRLWILLGLGPALHSRARYPPAGE